MIFAYRVTNAYDRDKHRHAVLINAKDRMFSGTNYIFDESSKSHEIAEHFGPVCKDREFRSWYDYIEAFKELEAE